MAMESKNYFTNEWKDLPGIRHPITNHPLYPLSGA
jgi:hypothetical protein